MWDLSTYHFQVQVLVSAGYLEAVSPPPLGLSPRLLNPLTVKKSLLIASELLFLLPCLQFLTSIFSILIFFQNSIFMSLALSRGANKWSVRNPFLFVVVEVLCNTRNERHFQEIIPTLGRISDLQKSGEEDDGWGGDGGVYLSAHVGGGRGALGTRVCLHRYHTARLVLHQGCVTTATGSELVTMTIQVRQPCRKGCQGNKKRRNCVERIWKIVDDLNKMGAEGEDSENKKKVGERKFEENPTFITSMQNRLEFGKNHFRGSIRFYFPCVACWRPEGETDGTFRVPQLCMCTMWTARYVLLRRDGTRTCCSELQTLL